MFDDISWMEKKKKYRLSFLHMYLMTIKKYVGTNGKISAHLLGKFLHMNTLYLLFLPKNLVCNNLI